MGPSWKETVSGILSPRKQSNVMVRCPPSSKLRTSSTASYLKLTLRCGKQGADTVKRANPALMGSTAIEGSHSAALHGAELPKRKAPAKAPPSPTHTTKRLSIRGPILRCCSQPIKAKLSYSHKKAQAIDLTRLSSAPAFSFAGKGNAARHCPSGQGRNFAAFKWPLPAQALL